MSKQSASQINKQWQSHARWAGILRPYSAEDVAKLRGSVHVEHTLARVGRWQGRRARYRGVRKNLFDVRRCAVVHNLHILARSQQFSTATQEVA